MLHTQSAHRPAAWLGCVLAVLLLVACGGRGKPVVYAVDSGATILAFGDSLTDGVGAPEAASYPRQLAALTGWDVVEAGVPGETTSGGRERLADVLEATEPDVVLLALGGNDMLRKQSTQRMRDNLAAMLSEIQAAGAQPILLAIPEPTLFGLDDHPAYAALAEQRDVPLIAGVFSEVLEQSRLRADRIHPNAEGYRIVAERVARALGY